MTWNPWKRRRTAQNDATRSDMEARARQYDVGLPVWQTTSAQSTPGTPRELREAVEQLREFYEADQAGDAAEPVPAGARYLRLYV
jgi:hypothetical protein